MLTLSLALLGTLFALSAIGLIVVQKYKLSKGAIVIEEGYNGLEHVSVTVHAIIRYFLKQSIYLRRFMLQYVFHVIVRLMHHFDILTSKMYATSRNWFVKSAVKNKGTVPHFWEHLKVYKQEMDQEKEEEKIG